MVRMFQLLFALVAYLSVASMITLAHRIGAAVVAEGVEDEEQLKWLRRSKCDYVQGFYVGRPQAPERIAARLNAATK